MPTAAILDHIRSLGYAVSIHRLPSSLRETVPASIEMHAIKLDGSTPPQVARCDGGNGPDKEYYCARLLCRAIGIDLE